MTTYSVPVAAPVDTGRPVRWLARDSLVILLYFALSLGLYWPLLGRLSSAIQATRATPF